MKFCPQCGAQLDDTTVFCNQCGVRVNTPETPPMPPAPAPYEPKPPMSTPQQQMPYSNMRTPPPYIPQPAKKTGSGCVIGIVIAGIVIFFGVVALVIIFGLSFYNANRDAVNTSTPRITQAPRVTTTPAPTATIAPTTAPSPISPPNVQAAKFVIINKLDMDIYLLYFALDEEDSWGEDRLGDEILYAGDSYAIFMEDYQADKLYSIYIEGLDDEDYTFWEGIDLNGVTTITIDIDEDGDTSVYLK